MSKLVLVIMILAMLGLIGFGIYKSIPYLKTSLPKNISFPQVQNVIDQVIKPSSPSAQIASPTPLPTQSPDQIYRNNPNVLAYLKSSVAVSDHKGIVDCGYAYLGANSLPATTIYIWAVCQEYYGAKDNLKLGAGINLPLALSIESSDSGILVKSRVFPRTGSDSGKDIDSIFPADISKGISASSYSEQLREVQKSLDSSAGYAN